MQLQLTYFPERVGERQRLAAEGEAAWRRAGGVQADLLPRWPQLPLLLVQGEWSEAREIAQAARSYILLFHREVALSLLGLLALWQGEPAVAWEQIEEMFPDGPETAPGGMSFYEALTLQRVAVTLALDAGDHGDAHRWLQAHDRYLAWSGAVLGRSEGALLWANYFRGSGDAERAVAQANQAVAEATEPRQPFALLTAHRFLGECALDAGGFDTAVGHLAISLALADACVAPFERARTVLALAHLQVATGEHEEARRLLADVRALCTPVGAIPTLARAEALAARLDTLQNAPRTYPAGLSEREVEVLRLLAAGKSNRQIADALFLSPGTVNVHVTHILTKTNTTNRTEAALFARDHGLA
jgi:DNA-binding CsgD family transcriptional regulator